MLNRYFVPVNVRNADYRHDGSASSEEKREYQRIYREALQARLSTGTVHVYILDQNGRVADSLHVAEAAKPDRLKEMLQRTVETLKPQAGGNFVQPGPQSRPPAAEPESLILHITSRYLEKKGNEYVRVQAVLGTERSSQWSYLPSEEWLTLSKNEWMGFLPPSQARAGKQWVFPESVTSKLLMRFYPTTENNDLSTNRIEDQSLRATVISATNGIARARIEGRMKMKHSFYHKDDSNMVEATLIGFLDFEPEKGRIHALQLVTRDATYGGNVNSVQPFGVAMRSVGQ